MPLESAVMSNILQEYYEGITQQLRAEVDFINALFTPQGIRGEGNETALRDLLIRCTAGHGSSAGQRVYTVAGCLQARRIRGEIRYCFKPLIVI
jgi:hypothetical protein